MLVRQGTLLVQQTPDGVEFPHCSQVTAATDPLWLGTVHGCGWFAVAVPDDASLPDGLTAVNLRTLLGDEPRFALCGKALHLIHWMNHHRFCGRCGARTQRHEHELALCCPACHVNVHPRISPAVIVAVVNQGRILLARNRGYRVGFMSVLAGFVEPGETLEECVAREVQEEAGIRVHNIRYFASQPWPFPDSLMVAFTAEYASGDLVVDNQELAEAHWFGPDELPPIPPPGSVARRLIDWFVASTSKAAGHT